MEGITEWKSKKRKKEGTRREAETGSKEIKENVERTELGI